jgi:hypothetical protein
MMWQARISSRRQHGQRGNVMMEFALIAPFLMIMLAGAFTLGMSLNRSIQASNVVRNANVLLARRVDLSRSENQQMLIRSASGLNFNVPGTHLPNPNGQGVIILTKVIKVGPAQCAMGISGWNGNPATCPNYGQYVIAQRIGIGNTSRWSSALGNPSSAVLSDGSLSDADIATVTTNRATGFKETASGAGLIFLDLDMHAYVGELFADVSDLNMLPWLSAPNISIRNVS